MRSRYKRSLTGISLMTTLTMMLLAIPIPITADSSPIKIGVLAPITYGFTYYGDMMRNGLDLGIEYATDGTYEVLGTPIQIIVRDTTGDPTTGASMAKELITVEGVDILTGCSSSAVAAAVQPVAETYETIFMPAPAAAAALTGVLFNMYTFRFASNTDQDAAGGATWGLELGRGVDPTPDFAFLIPDYIWGWSVVDSWTRVIEEGEGFVVHVEPVPSFMETNFVPYLERVIAANPHVFVPVWAGPTSPLLFEQIEALDMYSIMNVTTGIGDLAGLQYLGAPYVGFTGLIKYGYTLPDNPTNDWLVTRWTERYNAGTLPVMATALPVPDLFVASGFATGQAIVYAIAAAGGSTAAADLIPILQGDVNISPIPMPGNPQFYPEFEFMSPKGLMTMRDVDHQALQEMYIATIVMDYTIPGYPDGFLRPELVTTLTPEETAPSLAPNVDINQDHVINLWDKWQMKENWGPFFGPGAPYYPRADLNHDTKVNLWDLWILNANWGKTW